MQTPDVVTLLIREGVPYLAELIWTVFGAFLLYAAKKFLTGHIEQKTLDEALDLIRTATDKAHEEFVRHAKASSKDGKLSDDERAQARKIAKDYVMAMATGPVRTLIASWTEEQLDSFISRSVLSRKIEESAAKK